MASLPQVQQYISTRYYDSGDKSTDVHVSGISDKALSGIVHAMQVHQALLKNVEAGINNSSQQTSDLAAEIAKNNEERRKHDEHTRLDQIGQQRVHRAEQDILTGQIEDIVSGIDSLKNLFKSMFDSLKNILKDNFKRVMKAYDDFSATMRKKNVSTEDKNLAHLLADKAFLKTSDLGLNISEDQIREFMMGAINIGDFRKMDPEKLALAAQLKASAGLDERTILHIIQSANNDDELKEFVLRATDRFSAEAQGKVFEEVFKKHGVAANAVMWDKYGGNSASMMTDLQNTTRELARLTSSALTPDDIAELVTTSFLAQHGQIQELDNKLITDMLVAAGQSGLDGGQSLVNFFKDNLSTIQGSNFEEIHNQLLALSKNGDVSNELITHLSNLFMQVNKNGLNALVPDKLVDDAQLRETNRVNKQNGQLFDYVNRGIAWVNTATGGLLSETSTFLDELFGGGITTGDVVVDGFTNVLSVLKSIRFSLMAGSVFKLIKGAGSGIALGFKTLSTKLKGLFGSSAAALTGGKAAVTAATEAAAKEGAEIAAKTIAKDGAEIVAKTAAKSGAEVATSAAANSVKAVESAVSNTGKTLSKALQTGGKILSKAVLPVAMIAEGGVGMYEAYKELNTEIESTAEKANTERYKDFERQQNQQIKQNRAAAVLTKSALSVGGTLAGAKIGAAIGTAAGPLGTIIGGVIGAGVGLAGGLISDAIFKRRELNMENEKYRAQLDDLIIERGRLKSLIEKANAARDEVTMTKLSAELEKVNKSIKNINNTRVGKLTSLWKSSVDEDDKVSGAMKALAEREKELDDLKNNTILQAKKLQEDYNANFANLTVDQKSKYAYDMAKLNEILEDIQKEKYGISSAKNITLYNNGKYFEHDMTGKEYIDTLAKEDSTRFYNWGSLMPVASAKAVAAKAFEQLYTGIGDPMIKMLEGFTTEQVDEFVAQQAELLNLTDLEALAFRDKIFNTIDNKEFTDKVKADSLAALNNAANESNEALRSFQNELQSAADLLNKINNTSTVDASKYLSGNSGFLGYLTSQMVSAMDDATVEKIAVRRAIDKYRLAGAENYTVRTSFKKQAPTTEINGIPVTNGSYAVGGIVNSPTRALIGENGREAVLPLTKPDLLKRVLKALTREERLSIANSIMSDNDSLLSYSALSTTNNTSSSGYDEYAEDNLKERFRQVLSEAGLSDKISEFSKLYNEAVKSIVASVSAESAQYAKQYAKHALSMIGSGNKDQIVAALKEIISYLSGIAKNNTVSRAPAQKLPNNIFGR